MSAGRIKRFDYEVAKLRRAMLDADLDSPALALELGVNKRSLQNLVSGCSRSWPLRAKLNKFFQQEIFDPSFNRPRGRPPKKRTTVIP